MNGRNDEREIEDDGFVTIHCTNCDGEGTVWTHPQDPQDAKEVPCPECGPVPDCLRCHDTGYTRNVWDRRKEPCPDCWQDNGE